MESSETIRPESSFMRTTVPQFLRRFDLSFFKEGYCIEYFINKCFSTETISTSLIFSYDPIAHGLHVSRFYPELYVQSNPKYMSAACFYLLVHHCAHCYSLNEHCHISLETGPVVCDGFYKKLKDFNFHIEKYGLGNVVELISDIFPSSIDTSMIKEHIFEEGEIAFMK